MSDWSVIRLAVTAVGIITLVTVLAITFLLGTGREAPDGLIAIGAGGVGALATLLTGATHREETL